MKWVSLQFTKSQVNRAGAILTSDSSNAEDIDNALVILNNWRATHSFPLNTFQIGLRNRAKSIYKSALVVQRLKRAHSIILKLKRFKHMQLSRMQDIGGCRAVLKTKSQVYRLRKNYIRSDIKHKLLWEKNYIDEPKDDGYRSVHLIYSYNSDKNDKYNGRLIEIQIRSQLQHAWATAVETIGAFLQQPLKSNEGPEKWLHFLKLCSALFAFMENTTPIPNVNLNEIELKKEIRKYFRRLNVEKRFDAYKDTLRITQKFREKTHYYLLSLTPKHGLISVYSFLKDEIDIATNEYLKEEKKTIDVPGAQTVLVAADSLKELKNSYPNYFLDITNFINVIKKNTGK